MLLVSYPYPLQSYKFQYAILDPHTPTTNINNLRRMGTARGFGFLLTAPTSWTPLLPSLSDVMNTNRQFFLENGDQLDLHNDVIVAASGEYSRYTGGGVVEKEKVTNDGDYEIEITLVEPLPDIEEDDDEESDETLTLWFTSEGGYYNPFLAVNEPFEQIGESFRNPIYNDTNTSLSTRVGTNQGFSYQFPNVTFNPTLVPYNGNRKFIMDDGEMDIFNVVVLGGTGQYRKFTGTEFKQDIISPDPNWVATATFSTATEPSSTPITPQEEEGEVVSDGDAKATYDFKLIGGDAGFSDFILDYNTKQEIGNRFQNPVLNPSGKRIGTNQGFRFDFPPDEYTNNKPFYMANRFFQLEDGELNVMNEVIVLGTGIYSKYTGGYLNETLISVNPFETEITLVEKSSSSTSDDVDMDDTSNTDEEEVVEEVEDSGGNDIKSEACTMKKTGSCILYVGATAAWLVSSNVIW